MHAHFDHGVLTVSLPRAEQEKSHRRITVESRPPAQADDSGSEVRH